MAFSSEGSFSYQHLQNSFPLVPCTFCSLILFYFIIIIIIIIFFCMYSTIFSVCAVLCMYVILFHVNTAFWISTLLYVTFHYALLGYWIRNKFYSILFYSVLHIIAKKEKKTTTEKQIIVYITCIVHSAVHQFIKSSTRFENWRCIYILFFSFPTHPTFLFIIPHLSFHFFFLFNFFYDCVDHQNHLITITVYQCNPKTWACFLVCIYIYPFLPIKM